ncbi:hypothetical protein LCGC14_3000470, partial [marine sediment metagenome]
MPAADDRRPFAWQVSGEFDVWVDETAGLWFADTSFGPLSTISIPLPSSLTIGARVLDYVGGTLRIKHSYDRRCTTRFAVESDTELNLQEGEAIHLKLGGTTVFKGMLFKPVETWPGHT